MKKVYFTIAGTTHYHGMEFLESGMKVHLIKEPDNEYDKEAIRVEVKGHLQVGYVANSPYTVIGDSCSAGRMYDKIGHIAEGVILYVLPEGVLCTVSKKSLKKNKKHT